MENADEYYKNANHAVNSLCKRLGRNLSPEELFVIQGEFGMARIRCELPIHRGFFDDIFPEWNQQQDREED